MATTINTAAQFTAKLAAVVKATGKIQDAIHALAMYALRQNYAGNMNAVNKLLSDLPGGVHKRALAQWFVEFGLCKIDGVKAEYLKIKARIESPEQFITAADNLPFYEFHKQEDAGEVKTLNFQSMLFAVIAKAKREAAAGKPVVGVDFMENIISHMSESQREMLDKTLKGRQSKRETAAAPAAPEATVAGQ